MIRGPASRRKRSLKKRYLGQDILDIPQAGKGGNDDGGIAGLEGIAAGGDDDLAIGAGDAAHQHIGAGGHILKRHTDERRAGGNVEFQGFYLVFYHAVQGNDPAAGAVFHRADILQDAADGNHAGGNGAFHDGSY